MMQASILDLAHALCSPTRLYVLQSIGDTGMSVTDIASTTGIATSTACHHLAELVRVGLVLKKRKGRTTIYRWSEMRVSIQIEHAPPSPDTH